MHLRSENLPKSGGVGQLQRGFTLIELLLATSITVILLGILFNMTTTSAESLSKATAKVELSKRADTIFDQLAEDVSSMVIRTDGGQDWLYAGIPNSQRYSGIENDHSNPFHVPVVYGGPRIGHESGRNANEFAPPNICSLYFFTATSDKYDGYAGSSAVSPQTGSLIDEGGDVSMVEYKLHFRNEFYNIKGIDDAKLRKNNKWMLFRNLMHPDEAFKVLGKANARGETYNLRDAHIRVHGAGAQRFGLSSVLATHVYGVSVVFNVEYTDTNGNRQTDFIVMRPNNIADKRFRILRTTINKHPCTTGSNRVLQPNANTATLLRIDKNGRLVANCTKLFQLNEAAYQSITQHKRNSIGMWEAKAGIYDCKIKSMDVTLLLLDRPGEEYLRKLAEDEVPAYMRQEELIKNHGYSFSRRIDFPDY